MEKFLQELKRRNVFRVTAAYSIVGWVLLQFTSLAVPAMNLPDWVNSFVFFILIIGLPLIVIFTWAFELTPEGLKRTHSVAPDESIAPQTGSMINRLIIGALAVAVMFLMYERFSTSPLDGEPVALQSGMIDGAVTLAVLPFLNMSSDPEQEYFSDGITEEILNVLAGMKGLQVTSRTSAFAFKGQNLEIPEIAERLNVGHVLEGSVRKSGLRVRITAQLIEVGTDAHLWSQTYDRDISDVFAVQDEISGAIGEALNLHLLGGGKDAADQDGGTARTAVSTDAHDYYLKALQGMRLANFESIREAESNALRAIALVPDYVEAQALLAMISMQMSQDGSRTSSEMMPQARRAAARAYDLAPDNVAALLAMSRVLHEDNKHDEERGYSERALKLEPGNADALRAVALGARGQGAAGYARYEELMARVMALDPYNPRFLLGQSRNLRFRGRYDEALKIAERIKGIEPDSPYGWFEAADVYLAQGKFRLAIENTLVAAGKDRLDPEIRVQLSSYHLAVGDMIGARLWMEDAVKMDQDSVFVWAGQMLMADASGDSQAAMALAQKILEPGHDIRHWSHAMARLYMTGQAKSGDARDAALAVYIRQYPDLAIVSEGQDTPRQNSIGFGLGRIHPYDVMSFAGLLKTAGKDEAATRVVAELQAFLKERRDTVDQADYGLAAGVAALQSRDEEALDLLEKALDRGLNELWRQDFGWNPALSGIRGTERFKGLMARQETKVAAERALIVAAREGRSGNQVAE